MADDVYGLDFGTTNSLAALVADGRAGAFTDEGDRPHSSVVWYRGGDEIIVGREARQHLDSLGGGVSHGIVRSPKVALRHDGPLYIEGREVDPTDVVAEVLRYIRNDAADRHPTSFDLSRAVLTIPVDFGGVQRRTLRAAAQKAGIGIVNFVHEPAAALGDG